MFKYIPLQEQVIIERRKNNELRSKLQKATSDLDYIAMMTDVDLDSEEPIVDTSIDDRDLI